MNFPDLYLYVGGACSLGIFLVLELWIVYELAISILLALFVFATKDYIIKPLVERLKK